MDNIKILFVEKNEQEPSAVIRELNKIGCSVSRWQQVCTTDSLRTALQEDQWDIIVTDYELVEIGTKETLEIIKTSRPFVPVIVISDEIEKGPAIALLSQGASDLLRKSKTKRLVHAIVREVSHYRELKQATKILHDNEARYRTLVDNIPGIVYLCELNSPWRMLHMSSVAEALTEYKVERFVCDEPMTWAEIVHPDDLDWLTRIVDTAVAEHSQFEAEYRIITQSSQCKWVHEIGKCVVDSNNNPVWIDGVIMDITDKKQAEMSLREIENRYHMVFESANDAIVIHDLNLKLIDVNTLACEDLGYTKDELLQMNLDDIVSPAFTGRIQQQINLTYTTGKAVFESEYKRKDDISVPVEVSSKLVRFNNVDAVLCIVRDITERKITERALGDIQTRIQSIYNNMHEGMCLHEVVYDKAGKAVDYRVLDINPQFEVILKILKEEAIGSLASELYKTYPPPYLETYSRIAETGETVSFEVFFSSMERKFRITAFSPEKGKFVTLFLDITDIVNANKR